MSRSLAVLLVLSVLSLSSCATYSKRKHAVNVLAGTRTYSDAPEDVESPTVYGAEGLLGLTNKGLGLEGGFFFAEDDGTESGFPVDLDTVEYFLGLRNTWNTDDLLQPYVGGGLTYLDADFEIAGLSDSDEIWGGYLHGGIGAKLGIFQGGIDLRATATDESDLNQIQAAVFLGLTF